MTRIYHTAAGNATIRRLKPPVSRSPAGVDRALLHKPNRPRIFISLSFQMIQESDDEHYEPNDVDDRYEHESHEHQHERETDNEVQPVSEIEVHDLSEAFSIGLSKLLVLHKIDDQSGNDAEQTARCYVSYQMGNAYEANVFACHKVGVKNVAILRTHREMSRNPTCSIFLNFFHFIQEKQTYIGSQLAVPISLEVVSNGLNLAFSGSTSSGPR
jgi:hypothetical protein